MYLRLYFCLSHTVFTRMKVLWFLVIIWPKPLSLPPFCYWQKNVMIRSLPNNFFPNTLASSTICLLECEAFSNNVALQRSWSLCHFQHPTSITRTHLWHLLKSLLLLKKQNCCYWNCVYLIYTFFFKQGLILRKFLRLLLQCVTFCFILSSHTFRSCSSQNI